MGNYICIKINRNLNVYLVGLEGVVDLIAPDDDNEPIECPKCHKGNWEWL